MAIDEHVQPMFNKISNYMYYQQVIQDLCQLWLNRIVASFKFSKQTQVSVSKLIILCGSCRINVNVPTGTDSLTFYWISTLCTIWGKNAAFYLYLMVIVHSYSFIQNAIVRFDYSQRSLFSITKLIFYESAANETTSLLK